MYNNIAPNRIYSDGDRDYPKQGSRVKLASYAGFDVVFNDSGIKKGKTSISKKGNKFLRKAVFMPALSASKHNQKMKELYIRLISKGKNKKLALIAVARKLLLLIYTIWKNNTDYIPDYQPCLCK